jgi:hypothetical protein
MRKAQVSMPLFVMMPRKTMPDKKFIINLNNYRNWQHHLNNQIKIAYKDIATPKLEGIKFFLPIKLTFTLWKGTLRKIDRANVLSIHEKYFCDAMQECGCIPDDSDEIVYSTKYITGGIDRDAPRVDILIQEVEL